MRQWKIGCKSTAASAQFALSDKCRGSDMEILKILHMDFGAHHFIRLISLEQRLHRDASCVDTFE